MSNEQTAIKVIEINPILLTDHQVAEIIGVSKGTVRKMTKEGKFPPSYQFGERMTRWLTSDVIEWIEQITGRECK